MPALTPAPASSPWSLQPDFQSGRIGRVGLLRKGEWGPGGSALWQWRGLWASPKSRWKAIQKFWPSGPPPAAALDWFESDAALDDAVGSMEACPALFARLLHLPQVQRRLIRERGRLPYNKGHPLWWAIHVRSEEGLAFLLAAPSVWACLPLIAPVQHGDPNKLAVSPHRGPLSHAIHKGWGKGVGLLEAAGAQDRLRLPQAVSAMRVPLITRFLAEGDSPHVRLPTGCTLLGFLARRVPGFLYTTGNAQLSDSDEDRLVQVGIPLVAAGAALDIPDGKTSRSPSVREMWLKNVGAAAVARLECAGLARRMEGALPTGSAAVVRRTRM